MKKIFLAAIAILSALPFITQAQTNTLPSSGSVGIGTTSPGGLLHLYSPAASDMLRLQFNAGGGGNWAINPFIYGISNGGLSFVDKLNSVTPLVIGSTGNVGVGTTNPIGKLEVNDGNGTGVIAYFGAYGTANAKGLYFSRPTVSTNPVNIQGTMAGVGATNISLQADGGNVGVGTSDPISLFQVDDGCAKANIGDASGPGLNYGTSYLGFNAARSGTSWTMHSDGGNNGGGVIYSDIFGNMNFAAIASAASASNQVLSDATVKGNIYLQITKTGIVRAKAIKVETANWPDYVFKPAYQLPSLASVKAYIDQNRHLPEMPSEQDVAKNGIDLGEMVKLQTKKIEELTLYLLKENEAKQAQQKEIDELRKQVETLLKRKS